MSIQPIDGHSIHRITSGQVVIDLQTAVKELVENSLDAGATSIEVRFHNYGLKTIEVVDNGSGIAPKDYNTITLKHYTSKLSSFEELSRVLTFGFRGEALSSLCALADGFTVTTATPSEAPMGTVIEMDRNGKVRSTAKIARQRGTTITVSNLFKPLPVRRKELERNTKREFQKVLNLLHAYALVPCALESKGVRLTVSNQLEGGRKIVQFKTDGSPSIRASVLAVWGSKALENIVDLNLSFEVQADQSVQKRVDPNNDISVVIPVMVQGLISKFTVGAGRTSVDRQFFFVNGRPYNPGKVQKAVNEVYRTFSANQSPFVIANIIVPTNACDINVSPDKRTIFLHSENNLVQALKTALETGFASARSTYDVTAQPAQAQVGYRDTLSKAGRPPTQTQELEPDRNEKQPHLASTWSPTHEGPSKPSCASRQTSDMLNTTCRDVSITIDDPHPSLEGRGRSHSGSEPEPTLVAEPRSGDKDVSSSAPNSVGKGTIEPPRSRVPSEPLFIPESDEEETTEQVDKRKQKTAIDFGRQETRSLGHRPLQAVHSATVVTESSTAPSISVATPLGAARSSNDIPDKPRSAQTVLSTRGAAWNLRSSRDQEDDDGRKTKRARLSGEGNRVFTHKSFRSGLSRFVSTGKKARPDEDDEESESDSERERDQVRGMRKGGDGSEMDELDEENEEDARSRKKRPRTGRGSPQATMVVPLDDECAMDVDESPSIVTESSRPNPRLSPPISTGDDPGRSDDHEATSDDEWAFSSTLVGTYVPPVAKEIVPPPDTTSARSPTEIEADSVTLCFNLVNLGSYYLEIYDHLSCSARPSSTPPASAANLSVRSAISSANLDTAAEDAVASAALSRIISKADFEHMAIVGQFNLGFIIVRKRSDTVLGMDDLFIVDQHAADEKWNFETLQETTVVASQKLFRPQPLQLTAADEMLAAENMNVLRQNGFELEQVEERDESGEQGADENESGVRMRLHLVAQPMSKDTVFDMKDLEELLHLMQDRPKGTMVRCSKARAMFAMRACRRSVMVGKALDKTRMTAIVRHMGTMDQPWNCPHGRPTMRHLSDLTSFGHYVPPRREVDWEAYGRCGSRT